MWANTLLALTHALPPEAAHRLALYGLGKTPWLVPDYYRNLPEKPCTVWGIPFANPMGLAAGFDKNADALPGLARLGFGFIEVGTVTPKPQPGNPSPRLFRLTEDRAVINRLGFNNKGHAYAQQRLENLPAFVRQRCRIGVNIGKNKDGEAIADYVAGVRAFSGLADYLVVNISSPNTPGLRALQQQEALLPLLDAVMEARQQQPQQPPLLLKIAPDIEEEGVNALVACVQQTGVQGLIVSNTTVARPDSLQSRHRRETGGLSGEPLFEQSTKLLQKIHNMTGGELPLIAVGGVENAAQANAKRAAGASLVQLYTSLLFKGLAHPSLLISLLSAKHP
jgi:dihydroorotate dehydrogenase